MKEYDVTITETLEKVVTIEAESKDDALKAAEEMWKNADIILDAESFADVNYSVGEGREIDKSNELDVLLVKPGGYAKMTTIDADLASMQKIVGGYIQAVNYFDEPVVLVCNDEGKLNGLELNRAIKDDNGKVLDVIAGTFFICGEGYENFTSLPPEHREKFEKMFKKPEAFLKMGKGIMAIPVEPKNDAIGKKENTKNIGKEL